MNLSRATASAVGVMFLSGCIAPLKSDVQPDSSPATTTAANSEVTASAKPDAKSVPYATTLPAGSFVRARVDDVYLAKGVPTTLGETLRVTVFEARLVTPQEKRQRLDGTVPEERQILVDVEIENVGSSGPIEPRKCVRVLDHKAKQATPLAPLLINKELRVMPKEVAIGDKARGFSVHKPGQGRRDFVLTIECYEESPVASPRGIYVIPARDTTP